ncbi:MAG TPA: sigma-70 family RNA polymerase sigma factor [Puia sp.]|nr:sigma-70 family RNA polymerase sigma factor [Puia sp.]
MKVTKTDTVLTDDELIHLLISDETKALKEIYRKHWNGLLDHAYSFTRDEAAAKDIVQDVFVRMVVDEHLKKVKSNLRSYLYISVKRDCIRFLRTKFSSVSLNDSFHQFLASTHNEHSAHPTILKELEFHYEKELADLPPRLKQVFELSRDQGLSSKEISLQLGLSDQTVRNQLSQVIRILKRKLQLY